MFCLGTPTRMTEVVECFSAQKVVKMFSRRRYKTRHYHTASGDQFQRSQHRRNWEPEQRSQSTYAITVRIPLLGNSNSPPYMGGYYYRPCIECWKGPGQHQFWEIRVMEPHFEDDSARKIVDGTLNLPVRTIDEHFRHTETCANARELLWKKRDYISGKK
ncbi:hypothetical protein BPAE_0295g00110 [Botrytis paeoniae]|uniref:Uncharacterized protein n=1 Tax=Botrytis paeoniae TaxID=278948 RepID=A0A4Z1FAB2_9HELO|nr:hypothetical protein BPAE_0295g00110 [Botrytis paeoniae]